MRDVLPTDVLKRCMYIPFPRIPGLNVLRRRAHPEAGHPLSLLALFFSVLVVSTAKN